MNVTKQQYLRTSDAMRATAASLSLVSEVLHFNIVELWIEEKEGAVRCIYAFVEPELLQVYPKMLNGHHPSHKRQHVISPKLCQLAKASDKRFYWGQIRQEGAAEDESVVSSFMANLPTGSQPPDITYLTALKTEACYMLDTKTRKENVFIVCFSLSANYYSGAKIKFISGVGYAIYVAAYHLDEEENDKDVINEFQGELDSKNLYMPSRISQAHDLGLMYKQGGGSSSSSLVSLGDTLVSRQPFSRAESDDFENQLYLDTSSQSSPVPPAPIGSPDSSTRDAVRISPRGSFAASPGEAMSLTLAPSDNAPVWNPHSAYNYPIALMPALHTIPTNLTVNDLKEMKHLDDGSNSNVYTAIYERQKVIVKLIKKEKENDLTALHEFEVEHGMLVRMHHPNIIRILGVGFNPRYFLVLEYLDFGSLTDRLKMTQNQLPLFRRPTFTYLELLQRAKEVASALDYLHSKCNIKATIIHRDLKPDNIGFNNKDQLRLFDFGLCTVVKKLQTPSEIYCMTGNTGSLRYMAPEVSHAAKTQKLDEGATPRGYNEKVDVYSFSIIVWQMATDVTPFRAMLGREDFIEKVFCGGMRPDLDSNWPPQFSSLLTDCWQKDYTKRPSFSEILLRLDMLLAFNKTPKRSAFGFF